MDDCFCAIQFALAGATGNTDDDEAQERTVRSPP